METNKNNNPERLALLKTLYLSEVKQDRSVNILFIKVFCLIAK